MKLLHSLRGVCVFEAGRGGELTCREIGGEGDAEMIAWEVERMRGRGMLLCRRKLSRPLIVAGRVYMLGLSEEDERIVRTLLRYNLVGTCQDDNCGVLAAEVGIAALRDKEPRETLAEAAKQSVQARLRREAEAWKQTPLF